MTTRQMYRTFMAVLAALVMVAVLVPPANAGNASGTDYGYGHCDWKTYFQFFDTTDRIDYDTDYFVCDSGWKRGQLVHRVYGRYSGGSWQYLARSNYHTPPSASNVGMVQNINDEAYCDLRIKTTSVDEPTDDNVLGDYHVSYHYFYGVGNQCLPPGGSFAPTIAEE